MWLDNVEQDTANWTPTVDEGSIRWLRTQSESNSGFFSWFIQNIGISSDGWLENTFDLTEMANPNLIFSHYYNTEGANDGAVVEILVNGDWVDLGDKMILNGYNSTIDPNNTSRIAGRQAFSGNSNGFIQTNIDLSFYQGNVVNIRFRMVSDPAVGARGWYIDDVALWNRFTLLSNVASASVDGDAVFDLTQTEIIKSDLLDTIVVPIIDVNELIQVFPNPIVTDFTLKFESKGAEKAVQVVHHFLHLLSRHHGNEIFSPADCLDELKARLFSSQQQLPCSRNRKNRAYTLHRFRQPLPFPLSIDLRS